MAEKRTKTLSYRRAEWVGVSGLTLQKCIDDALAKLKGVQERSILHGDQFVRCAKVKAHAKGGVLLHITTETPGEYASLVPKVTSGTMELDLKTQRPPTEGEYLDGDACLYVNGDHVCLCATDVRDGAVRHFLAELFTKAKLNKNSIRFDLMKVADIKKVKLLKKAGVKELEIRATLFKATADYVNRKTQVIGFTGQLGKMAKAFLGKPNDVTPDGLRVAVSFKTDKRFGRKALALGEAEIETLAADVVNTTKKDTTGKHQVYDYVIKTGTGERITLDEIFMKSSAEIETDGKTVKCEQAWKELAKFFEHLEEGGVLEQ